MILRCEVLVILEIEILESITAHLYSRKYSCTLILRIPKYFDQQHCSDLSCRFIRVVGDLNMQHFDVTKDNETGVSIHTSIPLKIQMHFDLQISKKLLSVVSGPSMSLI